MTKLSISEEREEDKYDYQTVVKCWQCDSSDGAEIREATKNPQVCSISIEFLPSFNSF